VTTFRIVCALLVLAGLLLAVTAFLFIDANPQSMQPVRQVASDAEVQDQIHDFCGACHIVPTPDLLPAPSWPDEIRNAYRRYEESGRTDLTLPDQAEMTDYFCRVAPKHIVINDAPAPDVNSVQFEPESISLRRADSTAAVSFLNILKPSSAQPIARPALLLCDMTGGWFHRFEWDKNHWSSSPLCQLKHPDHVIACDFDQDGHQDFLLADLGTLGASDELMGKVILLRSLGTPDSFEQITIADSLGRVADAQIADIDGDGDNDFIIAEFGFEKAGALFWLETKSISRGHPTTERHLIDARHGAIHVSPTDLDGDGDLDLIALISQEHESIIACVNDGQGHFVQGTLYQADSPSFGSSGMELVDLDQDGDIDVLFTNGDTLDKFQLRPFHGVHWLENRGSSQFEYHLITLLPGAARAISTDLDRDGDLDLVAVAYAPSVLKHQFRPRVFDTVIWLEQTETGQFQRHSLERSGDGHMAVTAADFDGDGDTDLAVGEASFDPSSRRWLTIYWNQLVNPVNKDR
jgi:hypothetical protein